MSNYLKNIFKHDKIPFKSFIEDASFLDNKNSFFNFDEYSKFEKDYKSLLLDEHDLFLSLTKTINVLFHNYNKSFIFRDNDLSKWYKDNKLFIEKSTYKELQNFAHESVFLKENRISAKDLSEAHELDQIATKRNISMINYIHHEDKLITLYTLLDLRKNKGCLRSQMIQEAFPKEHRFLNSCTIENVYE